MLVRERLRDDGRALEGILGCTGIGGKGILGEVKGTGRDTRGRVGRGTMAALGGGTGRG